MPVSYQHAVPFRGDAVSVFQLFKDQPHSFFLDSSLKGKGARFSYIGFAPFTTVGGHDLLKLKRMFDRYRLAKPRSGFSAGAMGYLGYDGSLFFGLYDSVITVDHHAHQLIISAPTQRRVKAMADKIQSSPKSESLAEVSRVKFHVKSNFTQTQYQAAIRRVLAHIRQGDIYQINLSHRIDVLAPGWQRHIDAAGIYQALRRNSPSPFGAYFDAGDQIILSASPERFLKFSNGIVQVKPMKGTRPRGKSLAKDNTLKQELLNSPKEIAELLMVTDLERNDLGRVCTYGSVRVKTMRTIETYATVFQATSTIEGRLHPSFNQFDLLKATFPSGSVTGCPKIKAMEVISALEHGPRGLYTGALGYISFGGDMDFNVLIRTLFLQRDKIFFHVGGGIVADSKPQSEWQETWVKAHALIQTLKDVF